jgi:hypothetical protein
MQLRRALYRRDAAAVVELALDPTRPADVLQLLGDGLAVALGARLDGVRPVVVECVAALRARGWDGHVELADQLDALRGRADAPAPGAGGGTSSDCPRFSKATR